MGGGAKATGGAGNATGGASAAPASVARSGVAACSAAIFTFEETSTLSGCSAATGDEDGPAAREGAERSFSRARSAATSLSSLATRSRSHAASPSAANAAKTARSSSTSAPRRHAAAFRGARNRS